MAEGARLESVFTGNRNAGSNPAPSANLLCYVLLFSIKFGSHGGTSPSCSPPLREQIKWWKMLCGHAGHLRSGARPQD